MTTLQLGGTVLNIGDSVEVRDMNTGTKKIGTLTGVSCGMVYIDGQTVSSRSCYVPATEPKRMTTAQMNWSLKKGYAWELPQNNGSLSDTIVCSGEFYQWIVPSIDRHTREVVGGYFEALPANANI